MLASNVSPLNLASLLRRSLQQCSWILNNWSVSKLEKTVEGSIDVKIKKSGDFMVLMSSNPKLPFRQPRSLSFVRNIYNLKLLSLVELLFPVFADMDVSKTSSP